MYFTGTGNSRFVAERIAEVTGDDMISLNDILKNGTDWVFHSVSPFVFVVPVYAWRIPRKIEEILKTGIFEGSRKIYIVATMGSHAGQAGKYCQKLIIRSGMEYMGFAGICMPDNYLVSFPMMGKEEAIDRIRESIPRIYHVAERICYQKNLQETDKKKAGDPFLSGAVNQAFNYFMTGNTHFTISDDCIQCGICVRKCPVNNIVLNDGKISFRKNCMFCLGCIHHCPVHAIDYKGKVKKNGYYTCPPDKDILNIR